MERGGDTMRGANGNACGVVVLGTCDAVIFPKRCRRWAGDHMNLVRLGSAGVGKGVQPGGILGLQPSSAPGGVARPESGGESDAIWAGEVKEDGDV